jgi:hypothetical protein
MAKEAQKKTNTLTESAEAEQCFVIMPISAQNGYED